MLNAALFSIASFAGLWIFFALAKKKVRGVHNCFIVARFSSAQVAVGHIVAVAVEPVSQVKSVCPFGALVAAHRGRLSKLRALFHLAKQ